MNQNKKQQIAEALAGISYSDWRTVCQIVENSYHVTKKELTSEEVSSRINAFPMPSYRGKDKTIDINLDGKRLAPAIADAINHESTPNQSLNELTLQAILDRSSEIRDFAESFLAKVKND
ncbi:hypothetical protein ACPBEH_02650 [Latilactobacillus sp. 5-91]|uniref:hypothetical protein n=1 Tax=Latilactobacillus sp. 5-91 TaxID=3410924 RepID=UPI003C732873